MNAPTEKHLENAAVWLRSPERSNMSMLRFMSWVSLRLGRPVGRLLLHGVAAYFLLFSPGNRRASRSYLNRALGRPARWMDLYRHFFTFAATVHDRIYLINKRFDLFNIEILGRDAIQQQIAAGNVLFLMGAHMGSFEVIRAIGRQVPGLRVVMTMHEENAQKINAMLSAINPEAGQDIIGLGHIDSMLKVREQLENGTVVGMLADRTLGEENMSSITLLDTPADFPTGPFRMAALLRRPVMFMAGIYLGGNRYRIHFEPLADFSSIPTGQRGAAIQDAMARYAALLDQHCRATPYNWFNFFDFWDTAQSAPDERHD
jgi:predicted LPLAT superfamily acyltransferase